jgi:RNA-dependent RNA polymerase
MRYLPPQLNEWDLTRALALILHSDSFLQRDEDERFRKINFRVKVNPSPAGGVRNDGTGTLTLPTVPIGYRFLDYVKEKPLKLDSKKIKFSPSKEKPAHNTALSLQKTPFISPDKEEERQKKIAELQDAIRVDIIQLGIFFRRPSKVGEALKSREYSIEWQRDYARDSTAWLRFEYDHKLLRIEVRILDLSRLSLAKF